MFLASTWSFLPNPFKFIEDWNAELNDTQKNPLLRTYKQIKTEFTMEPYLDLVQNYRYRKAISSIRTS